MMSVSSARKFAPVHPVTRETKLCVIIDSKMPIIMKVPILPHNITLRQFKAITSLQDDTYKFYFRSHDSEFGIVKEEIVDEDSILPADGERIVVWVISSNLNQSSLFQHEENHYNRLNNELIAQNTGTPMTEYGENKEFSLSLDTSLFQSPSTITVQLELDTFNFLGLTLVGPSDRAGSTDRGIYISDISAGSVVEQDGRIEIGDRILEINNLDVADMRSDDAVALLRNCVDKRGVVKLVLQRNSTSTLYNRGHFTLPREYANSINQQIAPKIDPTHWSKHDKAVQRFHPINAATPERKHLDYIAHRGTHSLPRSITPRSLYTSNNLDSPSTNQDLHHNGSKSVYESSTPFLLRQFDVALHCGKDDVLTIYTALRNDRKSLDLKDRDWLKVVIKDAFLGSALVKWLSANVYGFSHKKEVKRYANKMLDLGFIRNPMASKAFSEKCYYTLSE